MKITKKALMALLIIFALFVFAPGMARAEDEDVISSDVVEKSDTTQAVESGAVEKQAPIPDVKSVEKQAAVEKIIPTDLPDKLKIIVMTNEKVKYKATELAPPPNSRILLQLSDCAISNKTIAVGKGGVSKIRTAQHDTAAWIVIDLSDKQKWSASQEGNRIIIDVPKTGAAPSSGSNETEAAPVVSKGKMMYRVIDIANKDVSNKKNRVIITADGPVKYRVKKMASEKRVVLTIIDAVSVLKKEDITLTSGDGPVKDISLKELTANKIVEVSIDLRDNSPYTVSRDQNQILIDIDKAAANKKTGTKTMDLYQKVSLNIQNAPLPAVLRLLSTQTGFEFAVSPSANLVVVTLREENQTLERVLRDLLAPNGMYYDISSNVIKVGSAAELKAEKMLQPKLTRFYYPRTMKAAQLQGLISVQMRQDPIISAEIIADTAQGNDRLMIVGSAGDVAKVQEMIASVEGGSAGANEQEYEGGLKTKVFKLQYVTPDKVQASIKNLLSTDGKLDLDTRTNSLIITDAISYLKKVEKVIQKLDTKLAQVMIEARLYEVNTNAAKKLGIRWNAASQNREPYIEGDVSANPMSGIGSLTLGMLQSGFNINAVFDALESKSEATLLSSPKITVENYNSAQISTTRKTYYVTTSIQQQPNAPPIIATTYNAIDLPITLDVAAMITEKNTINMKVIVTVTKVLGTAAEGAPPDVSTQSATTQVTAKNNETIVIGGLITDSIVNTESKVPILGDLPLIGSLFKGNNQTKEAVELVVFLTPSIVEE